MFQPIVPTGGLAGWRFLQRTYDTQFEAFSKSVSLQRDTDYFKENIAEATTAEALVSDRRLLTVALGAFGLQVRRDLKQVREEGLMHGQKGLISGGVTPGGKGAPVLEREWQGWFIGCKGIPAVV